MIQIIAKSTTPQSVIKASVCLKSYMLYMPDEVQSRGLIKSFFSVIDKLLDIKLVEQLSNYIGNIVMVVSEKLPNIKAGMVELNRRLLEKLSKCALPSTI